MVEDTVTNFLKGTLDSLWVQPSLNLYKQLYDYDLSKKIVGADDLIRVQSSIFVDGQNYVLAYFGEPLNLNPIVKDPKIPMVVDDVNALFDAPSVNEEFVLNTEFPYITVTEDLLASYNKKKRWKFRKSLELEGQISVDYVNSFSPTAMRIMRSRLHALDGVNNSVIIPQALANSDWNYSLMQIYKGRKTVGLAVAIQTAPDTVYTAIFQSVEPCMYHFVSWLHGQYSLNTRIHFGAAHTFDLECNSKYVYKHNIANSYLRSQYLLISDADGFPPYYSLPQKRWIT